MTVYGATGMLFASRSSAIEANHEVQGTASRQAKGLLQEEVFRETREHHVAPAI